MSEGPLFKDRPDGAVLLAPQADRFGLWEAALAAKGDATLVTGWGAEGRIRLRGATHLCVVGLSAPRTESAPPPTPTWSGATPDAGQQRPDQPGRDGPSGRQNSARVGHHGSDHGGYHCDFDRTFHLVAGKMQWLWQQIITRPVQARRTSGGTDPRRSYPAGSGVRSAAKRPLYESEYPPPAGTASGATATADDLRANFDNHD